MMLAFDLLLCALLVALALGTVTEGRLFRSLVTFVSFGLLMGLTWARLGSVDLALAEVAIGAGFTGALFLSAWRLLPPPADGDQGSLERPAFPRPALLAGCLGAGGVLAWFMLRAPQARDLTAAAAHTAMEGHVLGNPVTAVLLDFRGYDTLLEMAVLLAALLALRLLNARAPLPDPHPDAPVAVRMVSPLLALEVPVLSLMALWLLYNGAEGPGGAFQAGGLLGALGVLLRMTGRLTAGQTLPPLQRALAVCGLGLFTAIAWAAVAWSGAPLGWPGRFAYPAMLAVETALMLSIAATLVLLFGSAPGLRRPRRS